MVTNIYNASLAQTILIGNPSGGTPIDFRFNIILNCSNPGLLAGAVAVVRWNDGYKAHARLVPVALTLLSDYASDIFLGSITVPSDLTIEVALTGTASYRLKYSVETL